MQAWTYPENKVEEFGARRWTVEWWTIRAGAEEDGAGDLDWDRDLISNYIVCKSKEAAHRQAKRKAAVSHFGVAQVQEQVVDWYVEEERVAEWQNVGDSEEVAA